MLHQGVSKLFVYAPSENLFQQLRSTVPQGVFLVTALLFIYQHRAGISLKTTGVFSAIWTSPYLNKNPILPATTAKHHLSKCLGHRGKTPSKTTEIAFKLNQADCDFNKNSHTFSLVMLKFFTVLLLFFIVLLKVSEVEVYHFPIKHQENGIHKTYWYPFSACLIIFQPILNKCHAVFIFCPGKILPFVPLYSGFEISARAQQHPGKQIKKYLCWPVSISNKTVI